jgi:hypothetical protein
MGFMECNYLQHGHCNILLYYLEHKLLFFESMFKSCVLNIYV